MNTCYSFVLVHSSSIEAKHLTFFAEEPKMVQGKPLTGRMTHEANPVARWCFGNTSIAKNGQGYAKFVKEHKGNNVDRTKRIDLTAARVDAMARARFYAGRVDLSAAILSPDWGM